MFGNLERLVNLMATKKCDFYLAGKYLHSQAASTRFSGHLSITR